MSGLALSTTHFLLISASLHIKSHDAKFDSPTLRAIYAKTVGRSGIYRRRESRMVTTVADWEGAIVDLSHLLQELEIWVIVTSFDTPATECAK